MTLDKEDLSILMAAAFEAACMVACKEVDFQPSRFRATLLKTRRIVEEIQVTSIMPPAIVKNKVGRPRKRV